MPHISLLTPTAVTRSGATDNWVGLGDDLPATSGPYDPGDKSWYVRFQLMPDAPVAVLPSQLKLTLSTTRDHILDGTMIVDDRVSLGDIAGPFAQNRAFNECVYNSVNNYHLSTSAITLADLNAGNVYLWVGYKAIPTTPFNGADWNIAVVPTMPVFDSATPGDSSLDTTVRITATYIGAGTDPGYVPISITADAKGEILPFVDPG